MPELMTLDLKAPHQKYHLKSGQEVPGVTTILGVYAKEALLSWYAAEERAGVVEYLRTGRELPKTAEGKPKWFAMMKRDKAADLGTIAHAHIEARLLGMRLDPAGLDPDFYEQALVPAERFFGWVDQHKVTLIRSEFQMVSEAWKVGGTGDCFFRDPEGLTEYWDVKTGKPWFHGVPYDEQIAQSAAYANFYTELTGVEVDRIRIARVGKTVEDEGDLFTVPDEARKYGMALFSAAVTAYKAKYELKKALKGR